MIKISCALLAFPIGFVLGGAHEPRFPAAPRFQRWTCTQRRSESPAASKLVLVGLVLCGASGMTFPDAVVGHITVHCITPKSYADNDHLEKMTKKRQHLHCRVCGSRSHETSLETRRNCPLCGKEMARTAIYEHMRHACPKNPQRCPKKFSKKQCKICRKFFHEKGLRAHVLSQHSKAKKSKR